MATKETHITTLPNFLIIGAEKGGTTSLYHYLNQHPDIFMSPEKEPFYFICANGHPPLLGNRVNDDRFLRTRITDFEEYKKLFEGVSGESAIGEASASYIYDPLACKRIKDTIPNAKIIVVLRNPVDRAFSNFKHCVGRGVEPLRDFKEAINSEEMRMKENWGLVHYYKEKGYYFKYLKQYYDNFPKENIKVYLYDEYKLYPEKICKDIFSFLSVDPTFSPEFSTKHNVSKTSGYKNNVFTKILRSKNPLKLFAKNLIPQSTKDKIVNLMEDHNSEEISPMDDSFRQMLISEYNEDINNLEKLIDKDLSKWRN